MESSYSRFIVILVCIIVLSSSCVSANARAEKPRGDLPVEHLNRTEAVPGGYTKANITESRVKVALEVLSEHLDKDSITLKEPFEAWQQVVAGYKIRIDCFYTQNGVKGVLTGIVYISPDGGTKILDVQMSEN